MNTVDWTHYTLTILGLTETEVKVLECLTTSRSVQEIANLTSLSRTGINYLLKQLRHRGLVFTVRHGKRKSYVAAIPSQVVSGLQTAIDIIKIDTKDKKGARVKTSRMSEFIIHHGMNEIIPAYERIASTNKDARVRAIQPNKSWMNMHKKLGGKQLIKFNEAIRENGIIVDGILQRDAYKKYREFFAKDPAAIREIAESFENRMADYTFVSENFFNHNAEVWIYSETVFLINWQEEVAVEIRNEDIMNFMKDMFEVVKESGQKIDHNQAMREILVGA